MEKKQNKLFTPQINLQNLLCDSAADTDYLQAYYEKYKSGFRQTQMRDILPLFKAAGKNLRLHWINLEESHTEAQWLLKDPGYLLHVAKSIQPKYISAGYQRKYTGHLQQFLFLFDTQGINYFWVQPFFIKFSGPNSILLLSKELPNPDWQNFNQPFVPRPVTYAT